MVGDGSRQTGPPRSANGASSFHLFWEIPEQVASPPGSGAGLVEVSAVLEVLEEPQTKALYFWALQVDFVARGRVWGGGHTGLQWNNRHPGSRAINWGGYAAPERGGSVLPGTQSLLSGFRDDANTRTYPWRGNRPYRFRVFRSPDVQGAWRSEVTDLLSGTSTTIRDLFFETGADGRDSYLVRPVVWSEVFADCDAPSVTVRWSRFEALAETGSVVIPRALRVNYQSTREGGCSNTNAAPDETGGILQITNTLRTTGQGSRLVL